MHQNICRFNYFASAGSIGTVYFYSGGIILSSLKLSVRLETLAKLVPKDGSVADVGTDHGYIPVWLAQNGHRGALYATDIKKAPLEHARRTAEEYGQAQAIEFYLCNGLSALCESAVETVIIAGMGGENIAEILAAAPWVRESGCLLILQPMSKSAHLRSWLFENGYTVLSEQLADDGGIYEVLTARAGKDLPYSPAELLIGHRQLICGSPLYERRLDQLIGKTKRAASGLSASQKAGDAKRLNKLKETLLSLQELKNSGLPTA